MTLNVEDLNGNTIKSSLHAKRVRKTYHNIQKEGTGNFGFVIVMKNDKWYRIDGTHNSKGDISNLNVSAYGTTEPNDYPAIKSIHEALFKIREEAHPSLCSPTTRKKIPVKTIMIRRAEGSGSEVGKWRTFRTFASANAQLRRNALTAPQGGAYDKHDFKIVWEDEKKYEGRLDVKYPTEPDNDNDVGEHVRQFIAFYRDDPRNLGFTLKEKQEAREFLQTYSLGDN